MSESIPPMACCAATNANASSKRRAAFYVDGFNFYHALRELNKPHLKWVDWKQLADKITAQSNENVCKIVVCTAPPKHMTEDVLRRHTSYVHALLSRGIIVKQGWFQQEQRHCRADCYRGGVWPAHTEKEGDVSLALSIVQDAFEDAFDTAYLVTSDTDQAPTLRLLRDRFGESSNSVKETVVVSPVWRGPAAISHKLVSLANRSQRISEALVAQCLLPKMLIWHEPSGNLRRVYRPAEYEPPVAALGAAPVSPV